MEDLNHVTASIKTDATAAETAVKNDVSGFDARAAAAKRRAMDALNEERTWIDRHPILAGVIVILSLAAAAAMAAFVLLH